MEPTRHNGLETGRFHKSYLSKQEACAYAAFLPGPGGGRVQVQYGEHGQGGALTFTPAEWEAFIGGVKAGEFDLPPGTIS